MRDPEHPWHRGVETDQQHRLGALDRPGRAGDLDEVAGALAAEAGVHRRADGRGVAGHLVGDGERRRPLSGEVAEVEAQLLEVGQPAVPHVLEELLLPVRTDAERRRHHAHDARAARAGLDEELADHGCDRAGLGAGHAGDVLAVDEAVRGFPADDLGGHVLRAHVRDLASAEAFLRLRRQEPGAEAGRRGERLPDLLGRTGDLDLELETEGDVGGSHDSSSGSSERGPMPSSELIGRGWAATTRRCGRPSSWW